MPVNQERRNQILDAAIDILCDDGVGGLTHRQVDSQAAVPTGTTSNYFRTRLALLEATAHHVVDLHWQAVAALQNTATTLTRDDVAALMLQLVAHPDDAARRRQLARYELFNEAVRRPSLRPFIGELQSAAMKSATVILQSAGLQPTDSQVQELSRLLNGLAYSNLTFVEPPGDQTALVDRMLRSVLD